MDRILKRMGWRKLDDLTISDIVAVGLRYGVRFKINFKTLWSGPWRRREDGTWVRTTAHGQIVEGPRWK